MLLENCTRKTLTYSCNRRGYLTFNWKSPPQFSPAAEFIKCIACPTQAAMFDADQGESVGFCGTRLFANCRSCSVNSAAVSFALEYGSYGSAAAAPRCAGCREPSSRSSGTPAFFALSLCAYARMSCASCQAIVSVFVYGNIASSDLGDVCTGELCEHQHAHAHAHAGGCARGACMRRRARPSAYIARGYIRTISLLGTWNKPWICQNPVPVSGVLQTA